ncbi:MAG: flagellar hook-associated protein FlgL [Candidatus Eisenbacteria bacterium]|nr:flagellar hook-associated protein FlgL [Candidatus Eisenbacteria bacterium]
MRIPSNRLSHNMMNILNNSMGRIERIQTEMATGRRIQKPSDDPRATRRLLALQQLQADNTQYQGNIADGLRWLTETENSLNEITEVLMQLKEIALQAANEVPVDRNAMASTVNELLTEFLDQSRVMIDDRYLFSGYSTSTAPYTASTTVTGEAFTAGAVGAATDLENARIESGSLVVTDLSGTVTYVEGVDYEADYETGRITLLGGGAMAEGTGYLADYETETYSSFSLADDIEGEIVRQVARDRTVNVNLVAPEVFQADVDLFEMVVGLKNQLWKDDAVGVQGLLDSIDTAIDHVTEVLGVVGTRSVSLENQQISLESNAINLESMIADLDGVDLAEAVVRLQAEQMGYEAALATSANLMQMSLVNYL